MSVGRGSFRLVDWRKARRMTGEELARRAGLSKPYISQLETGARRYTQETLEALAAALECTPAQLLGDPPPAVRLEEVGPWRHPSSEAGHFIKAWRKHRRLTLQDLADLTGTTHSNLSRLERGAVQYGQKMLEKLAGALQTDPASLILACPGTEGLEQVMSGLSPGDRVKLAKIARVLSEPTGGVPEPSPRDGE